MPFKLETIFALCQASLIYLITNCVYLVSFLLKFSVLYVLFCLFERCFCRKNIRPKRANGFVERIFTYFFDILIDYDFICKRVQSSLDHQMSNERHLERQQTVQTKSLNEYMKHVIKSISKWISNIYHLKSDSLDPILINVATDKQKESFQTRLPLLNVCLSHNDRRINVTAMISTASTCSLISSDIIDQLHVRPKHIWPILIRESIGRPLQISVRSALVTIESIKQFYKENDNYLDDNDNQTTIKHDLELVVIGTNQFSINNNNNNDGDHNNNRIQLLIGQDILNWSINTLPIRVNHYQIDNLSSVLHFSTQYGRTCMGTASQTMSNNLKLIENVIKYQRKVLPWRKSNQSILSGITRDIEVILGFIFGLSMFAIFDWAFMLIVTISPLLLFLYFCIPSNWFGGMHRTAIRSTIHTIISNGFIVLYGLRLMGNWCCNQTIYSSIDRHTYKPTLMVLIRGKRSETICRVVLDSSEPKSMISRRVLTEIDEILHSSESIIQMEMYSLDDQTIRTNVEFNIEDRIFWDYLPTPSRSLREVISVQHGVSLTDDTDEMLPFGSVDIILGIDQLSKSIYMENEMISIYLGPNLTLQPTRFGWTLTGTHYPLIRKSLQTIYELERRTIDHLSHYLVPFVAFNMICLVLISIIIDLLYIGHLTNRFASHNSTIVTDCAQFMLKSDYVPLLSHWYDHGTRIMSCSIYRETFFRLIPFWPNQSIN